MPNLLIATKNAHKTQEFRAVLGDRWDVSDLCGNPQIAAPEETGSTFSENAAIKALSASNRFDGWVLADDSGLAVDALNGAPGVISARYAGPGSSDAENRARLLRDLADFPAASSRRCRFHCVLALAKSGEIRGMFQGICEGTLLAAEQGEGGFGYDSLFVPQGHADSFGVLPSEIKNAISHRARALEAFQAWLLENPDIC
jgi:XTP/dITP diphosphohydrolase